MEGKPAPSPLYQNVFSGSRAKTAPGDGWQTTRNFKSLPQNTQLRRLPAWRYFVAAPQTRPLLFDCSDDSCFDGVPTDIMTPVMDGCHAAVAICALSRRDAAAVSIITVTDGAFGEDVRKHIEESMNGHVSKPIAPQAPCARLSETIAKKHLAPSQRSDGGLCQGWLGRAGFQGFRRCLSRLAPVLFLLKLSLCSDKI